MATGTHGLPSLWEIAKYWAGPGKGFCVDLSRPACAGCGCPVPNREGYPEFEDRWTDCGLHRGHLINACAGGPDVVENLVPLCPICNYNMPVFGQGELQAAVDWVLDGGWIQKAKITEQGLVLHGVLLIKFASQ